MPSISEARALELLAESVGSVVGRETEVYREMMRAFETQEMVDMMLAQSSFDSLQPDIRQQIAQLVTERIRAIG